MKLVAAALLVLATQQLPKPTFETGVDIISVDVHVVDKNGKPIVDLKPDDFEVDISGRRRKISSVQFVSYAAPNMPGLKTRPTTEGPSSEAAAPRPRRMFVIAVDEHSLHTSNAMAAVTAAERFIDRLQPDDLVGLYAYPTGAAKHDMTTDHASVRKMLQKIAGLFSEPANNLNLSPSEVIDCANSDSDCLMKVWQRECSPNACTQRQIQQEAVGLAGLMETMASQSVGGLRGLLRSLKDIPGRKTLVMVSGGLVTTDQPGGRMNLRSEIAAVGRDASLANVNVFALHLDWSFIQAVTNRRGLQTSYFREANMAASGLEAVAGNAGGTVIRVHGTSPDVAFDRVLSETSGHYLLGVESIAADRDGQPHAIRVKVKRGGAQVRSRTFVTMQPEPRKNEAAAVAPERPPAAPGVPPVSPPDAPPPAAVTRSEPDVAPAPAPPADPKTPVEILAKVARYLEGYERELSGVVLEESLLQQVAQDLAGPPEIRRLKSDVLLIPDPELDWVGFRDVYEVDGRPVRDRDQRLQKLFLGERTSALEHAARIASESARYNASGGRVSHSINMPMLMLRFLSRAHQPRSRFRDGGMKSLQGRQAVLLEFDEREKPRLIKSDNDAAVRGRAWIDPVTGTVLRTELRLQVKNPAYQTTVNLMVRVTFERNEKLGIWLPDTMDEEYRSGPIRITGTAAYSNPRRFTVSTTQKIK